MDYNYNNINDIRTKQNKVRPYICYLYALCFTGAFVWSIIKYLQAGGISHFVESITHPTMMLGIVFGHIGNDLWDTTLYNIGAMDTNILHGWGFLYRPLLSLFYNYNIMETIVSILAILLAGSVVERIMGHARFFIVTLLTGYLANLCTYFITVHYHLPGKVIASSSPFIFICLSGLIALGLLVYLRLYNDGDLYIYGIKKAMILLTIIIIYDLLVPTMNIFGNMIALFVGQIMWILTILISYLYHKWNPSEAEIQRNLREEQKQIRKHDADRLF